MTKKELVEGFKTYMKMNEDAKEADLDKRDLNRRTMWGVVIFLVGYSIFVTLALVLKFVEYFLY